MATSIASILARLGFVPAAIEPEPVPTSAPGCEPWCRGRGSRRRPAPHHPVPTDRLPSVLETLRAIPYDYCPCPAGDAARERHREALAALEARAVQREAAAVLDAAELPPKLRRYGLDDYPALAPMIEKLRRWQPVSRSAGTNLLLLGDIGTYKTTLAAALLREHLADGGSGLFLVLADFLGHIRASYGSGTGADDRAASEWTLVRAASKPGLLVVDDVPPGLSEWAQGIVFRLLNDRDANERPTILTTNLDLAGLEASLGKRTFDRFRGGAIDSSTGEQFVCKLAGASQRGLSLVKPATGPRA